MPLDETIETYAYFIKEADKMGLAYICLVRYAAKLEVTFDDKPRSINHDVLATYGPLINRAAITLNADLTPDEGEQLVASGKIAGGVYGWSLISNPDFVTRLKEGKGMNNDVDFVGLYGGGLKRDIESQKQGYVDYPFVA